MKKSGLGRGLGVNALIADGEFETDVKGTEKNLPINEVEPNRNQPRKEFDKEKLEALADSIREHGIVQPLIVVREKNYYRIVAGERRWRAAKLAGLKEVPALVRDYEELEAEQITLIENLQREDLNPIEEAAGLKQLMDKFSLTQEEVSQKIGKSRSAVANSLRLLNLPEEVCKMLKDGKITVGHAKVLLGVESKKRIIEIAKTVVDKELNVRQTELLVRLTPKKETKKEKTLDENVVNAINDARSSLERKLGTKVKISYSDSYKGKVEISFKDLKQMTAVLEEIGK